MRTMFDFEIDGDDVFGDGHTELRDRDVAVVLLVRVERGAIRERDREAGIVRARASARRRPQPSGR